MKTFKIGFFITLGNEKQCDYHCVSDCGKYKRHKWKLIKSTVKETKKGIEGNNFFECVQCGIVHKV